MAQFFIDRPIFAWVISIVIVLLGGIAVVTLPIAQYPEITPPTVQVTCMYPGANAKVVADSVAAPIEEQVNGVERMLYMSSQATNDGSYTLTVTFELGTDLNIAQVLVQNRVQLAMPKLPQEVQVQGVSTKKKSPAILLVVNLFSPDGSYDDLYLSNYATIFLKDELLRLKGVGDINFLGQRDYSMRVWLDPDKMAARNLTAQDVVNAVKKQNVQVAAGQIGAQPVPAGQQFQFTMSTLGRLEEARQFGDIILTAVPGDSKDPNVSSQVVRIKDIARIELGAQQYDQIARLDGRPSVGMAIFQLPGANALQVADSIKSKMKELKQRFPTGLDYAIVYDTTPFIKESVMEVFKALRDAIILVAIVVLLFLQDYKAMILPMIDVPVSLVGTFGVMALLGFSLNNITLLAMVLAIGIVVDDAIVVLENIERQISLGHDPRTATIKAMAEVTGPIIAITLVLISVFLPAVFIPGITGQFFKQFALVIASAMVISAINAMTLTPARAVAIFKTGGEHGGEHVREALPWWIFAIVFGVATMSWLPNFVTLPADIPDLAAGALLFLPGAVAGGVFGKFTIRPINLALSRFFKWFNRGFDWVTEVYGSAVARSLRIALIVLAVYGGLLVVTYYAMSRTPMGFVPEQDQGYLLVNVQLRDAWSVQETDKVMKKIERMLLGDDKGYKGDATASAGKKYEGVPGVAHVVSISGQSFLMSANGSNFGSAFCILEDFHHRGADHDRYDAVVAAKLRKLFADEIDNAVVTVFRAPPIQGLGNAGGFKFQLEQRGFVNFPELQKSVKDFMVEGNPPQSKDLIGVFSLFRAETPQKFLDIDRTKCESLGVDVNEVFSTLQVFMGGQFVNLFNRFGRTWQVNLMADMPFRKEAESLNKLKVRNKTGDMVPLGTLARVQEIGGPVMVTRYNMYNAAAVSGNPAAGISSGQAIKAIDKLARDLNVDYEWTEITYMQILAGSSGILVFFLGSLLVYFVLAAKYESWSLPASVILVVPMCLLASVVGLIIAHLDINIFVQVGFIVLVGLAAKNAILIVEFAMAQEDAGMELHAAAVDSSKQRLRPIVMTSFAFILGVVPLVITHGAGAEMRHSMGVSVFAGMLGVTGFGIFLTPVFYFVMRKWAGKKKKPGATGPAVEGDGAMTGQAGELLKAH